MSLELINNRIASFTPEYRDFVMSDFSDAIAANIAGEASLDNDTETAVSNMIFLYTILILSDYELTEALVADCDLGMNEALRITKSILSMMPPEMLEAQRSAYAEIMKSDNPIDEKTRRDIIAAQPERQKLVYLYTKTNPHLRILMEQFALSEEQIETGIVLLGDITLGFYRTEDTVPLLQQELGLDPKTAALLGAEVIEFLTPLSDPNWQPPVEMADVDEDEDLKDITDNEVPTITPVVNHIPEKAPALALNPIHTLASDMATVRNVITPSPNVSTGSITPSTYTNVSEPTPVYQSTQPVPKPLSTIPSYTPAPTPPAPVAPPPVPDRPRWSTEI
jgi:hypothetical protein